MGSQSAWRQAAIGCGIVCTVLAAAAFAESGYRILKRFPVPSGEETWDYIAIDEAGRRLFLAHDTQVEVLSAETGELLGTIADTKGAHATVLVPEFNRGFITNGDNATVTMFDFGSLKKLSEIHTGDLPDGMVYEPSTKRVFSMNTVGRNSTAIDAKDGTVVGTVDLDGKPEQATADGAGHLFVDLKDKAVVARIDARKLAIDQRWPIAGCDRPTSIALDKKARRLFVGCRNLMLYVMDSENGRVITHLPIGDNVDNTVFDPGTGLIFTSTEDAKITVMHEDGPDAYRVVETVKTAPGSKTMALDLKTHRLFVPYGEVEKVAATPGSTGGGKVDLSGMRKRVLPNTFGVLVVGIGDSPPATARRTLATTGPDTMEGMMKAWIAAFNKTHPDAEVTFALKECHPEDRCTAGPDVDEVFANTSAAYAEKYRYEPFRVMVSLGGYDTPGHIQALGVYVHPSNPIQKLTLAQLDAIYSPERRRGHPADVTAWGDVGLGGEWASKPIHAYGRSLSNEVAWYFKDIVTLDGPYKPSYIQPGKAASVDIMTALAGDPYGIGYSGFAYRTDKVKAIALADRDGVYVEPSRMAVASAKYPLQRPLYIYVNRAPGKPLEPLAREFLAFVLSEEGQQIGAVDGMLPLPLALAAAEQARLQ